MKKRNYTLRIVCSALLTILTVLPAAAQTLNVKTGQVTYVHKVEKTGDMTFTGGATLTVEGKPYPIADITNIVVDNTAVADSTVSVAYNGTSASVVVSGDIAKDLTVTVSGATVNVVQDPLLQSTVTYTLSGSSSNGSFTTDGNFKINLNLQLLTLTSTNGPAINVLNGKAIHVNLTGANTLRDVAGGLHSATFYINGHATFAGAGSLTAYGLTKHAIATDEHAKITGGTINVEQAAGDGLHINERLYMSGGTVNVKATGDGIDVEFRGVNKGTKDQYAKNGFIEIDGGTLNIVTTGTATKAIKADSTIVIAGGNITAKTSGNSTYDNVKKDTSSPSAVKTGGAFNMTSGTLTATSTGTGGKGINATGDVTISGGKAYITTTGSVYQYNKDLDTKPQGVKSDGNIIVSGGSVYVCAGSYDGNATAFKPGKNGAFYINGGNVMGISRKKTEVDKNSKQASKNYSGVKVTGGQTLTYDELSYTVPSNYSISSANIIVSKAPTTTFSGAPRQ